MVKHASSDFGGLEERINREEKVRKNEMDVIEMKLNKVEMLLWEQMDEDQQYG